MLSFKNVTYNIRTNAFVRSHDSDDYLTLILDYMFDRQAKWLAFRYFINETFLVDEVNVLRAMMLSTVIPKDRYRFFYRH